MPVAAAREAYERREWRAVLETLESEQANLDAADLELFAHAAWWLGDSPRSMAVAEETYQRLLASGDLARAADTALRLTLQWAIRGDVPVSDAWHARARRLLADLPRSPLHGYLAYVEGALDLDLSGDPGPAVAAAAEVAGFAQDFDDPTLSSFALTLGGMAAIRSGRTVEGFAGLDEAMLPVLAGHVEPLWAGDIFCTVIHLCDDLADLGRMRSWTGALGRWSAPQSQTFLYAGVTRIHELQLVAAEGGWDTVEAELGDRSASLVGAHGWLAGEGYYTLAEVRRLRGDHEAAAAAYGLARELGHCAQPGAALLARDTGHPDEALTDLQVALAEVTRLERARLLPAMVELALDQQDPAYAATLAGELTETARWFDTPGLHARSARSRALLLLHAGDADGALPLLAEATRIYRDQRHRHASAGVHELLATAHRMRGETHLAATEEATALAIYRQLGAAPDLARLTGRERPGGLTERELEVLGLVVTGASNQAVADALTISTKTVSRHLANIFAKIGVSSRTAAAAWARAQGL